MSERILAIDPGERVGWAAGTLVDSTTVTLPDPYAGIQGIKQGVSQLKDFALTLSKRIGNYDIVVYETWRLYPGMARKLIGNDMQPAQLIGIIRLLGWMTPAVKLVSQGPNIKEIAQKSMPDFLRDRMKKCTEQHDQDALLHLWYYAFRRQHG